MAGEQRFFAVERERSGCACESQRQAVIGRLAIDPLLNQGRDINQDKLILGAVSDR
jgi:hypothetical protein